MNKLCVDSDSFSKQDIVFFLQLQLSNKQKYEETISIFRASIGAKSRLPQQRKIQNSDNLYWNTRIRDYLMMIFSLQSSKYEQLQSSSAPGLQTEGPCLHPHWVCVARSQPEEENQDGRSQGEDQRQHPGP